MPEILYDTYEWLLNEISADPILIKIYNKILDRRDEDKRVELWVYLARMKRNLIDEDKNDDEKIDDAASWSEIYGSIYDDDKYNSKKKVKSPIDRTKKAQSFFLSGLLEIVIFEKNWIANTVLDKNYFQFQKKINQLKNKFLPKDQFIFEDRLDYSIESMLKWQNYLIYKEKIHKDIISLQSISDNQKEILKSIIIQDEEITDLEAHINDTMDDSFSPNQQEILKKIIEKRANPSLIKKYIKELKSKVDDKEINVLGQMATFIGNNEKLIFPKKPRFFSKRINPEEQFLNKKIISKKPWKVFANNELFSNYYNRKVDNVIEKKFPNYQESLKTINFKYGHGSIRPSIANMIIWINYLSTIDNILSTTPKDQSIKEKMFIHKGNEQMNDETSLFKREKKKRDEARADKTIISEDIKKILAKIERESYKGLTEEEMCIIDQKVIESPKILWEFEAAKLTFTEKKIAEDYNKRKALKEAARKKESLWELFIQKLQNFSEQMTIPKAAASLVTAGLAVIIISYGIYSSGPAKFNVDLQIIATTKTRAGSPVPKEFILKKGGELNSENKIRIIANIDKAAFIYIIFHDSSGNISLINDEVITAVKTLVLPGKGKWYPSNMNTGEEAIYLIASKRKIKDIKTRVEKLRESGIDNINKVFKKAKVEPFRFVYK